MRGIGEPEACLNRDRPDNIRREIFKPEIENLVAQIIYNELVWVGYYYLETLLCGSQFCRGIGPEFSLF